MRIQESDILLSTKNIASGNGQSGYGNFLRCRSCWRLASSDTRSRGGVFWKLSRVILRPASIASCYRRYRLQKFGRILKTPRRVFLKEASSRTTTGCGTSWSCSPVRVRADADTSPHREYPGMVFCRSASPRALRQASTDPSGCLRRLPRIVPDSQTRVSRQKLQA